MLISQRNICDCVLLWGTALHSCPWETKKKKIAIVCQFGVNFDLLQIPADRSNHYITHRVQHWFPWSHTWIEGTASEWVTTESYQVLFVDLVCGKKRVFVVKWGSKIRNQSTCNLERPVLLLFAFHSKSLFANMLSWENWLICWVAAKCISEKMSSLMHHESSPHQCRGVCVPFWFRSSWCGETLLWWISVGQFNLSVVAVMNG